MNSTAYFSRMLSELAQELHPLDSNVQILKELRTGEGNHVALCHLAKGFIVLWVTDHDLKTNPILAMWDEVTGILDVDCIWPTVQGAVREAREFALDQGIIREEESLEELMR